MPEPRPIEQPENNPLEVEKVLFAWNAPSRPFVQKSREFWIKTIAIALIFGFIIFLVEGAMPVILMIALMFLFYILSTVRPENITYTITNLGINIGSSTNHWEDIKRFWFLKKGDDEILVLNLFSISGRLELVIIPKDKDQIRQLLKKYIPEEETIQTGIDKASQWLGSKLS